MKFLTIGLLSLISFSSLAQDVESFTIVNKTNGRDFMSFTCKGENCQKINVLSSSGKSKDFSMSGLIEKSTQSRKVVVDCKEKQKRDEDDLVYLMGGTRMLMGGVSSEWKRGNEVGAIAVGTFFSPFLLLADTILLPYTASVFLVDCIDNSNRSFNRKSKKTAKLILEKINNFEDIELKEVQFKKLHNKIFFDL